MPDEGGWRLPGPKHATVRGRRVAGGHARRGKVAQVPASGRTLTVPGQAPKIGWRESRTRPRVAVAHAGVRRVRHAAAVRFMR